MEYVFFKDEGLNQFHLDNKELFEERLLEEAVNVKDKIEEIKLIGNINLIANAHNVVLYVVNGNEKELIEFGKKEGIAWAKNNLTLSFKIEWIQAIRMTLWDFLNKYRQLNSEKDTEWFYKMGKQINRLLDVFFKGFFLSYSHYKDDLIESQRKLVEHLSVPVIPVSSSVSVIPLIGTIDEYRAMIMEEKVLQTIRDHSIQTIILDLSGIAEMDYNVIQKFMKLFEGIKILGCDPIITGLRPEVVSSIAKLDMSFSKKAKSKATLQQAIKDYL
ncbi:STAS domain-containing protein [Oceanobacillus piezotolerans]|uniref:STAS domain-containing protein n=1 Tax=Oceanobacillus piezotolerans TaxID=2448030 RepID=A0A498D6R6_9BACI|nr:STAS domain-containing protein [Oceanobacillus piezotolerans]RLL45349.1 STAS domain-containing protein [Oceanobacillus piezotolerans]